MQNRKALLIIAGVISLACVVCACLGFAAFMVLPLPARPAAATIQPASTLARSGTRLPERSATAVKPTARPSATLPRVRATATTATTALPSPTAEAQATGVPGSPGHRFVASAQAKTYYYCYTDPAWKTLKAQLIWSDDESAFTAQGLKLHAPCK